MEEELETLTQESIAIRAYQLWQARGCPEGSPEVDWLQAEDELLNGPMTHVTIDELLNS
jgi:hypothetical protein